MQIVNEALNNFSIVLNIDKGNIRGGKTFTSSLNICPEARADICKRLRSPGIDSEESIPPEYVAWRASTTNRVDVPARQGKNRFLGSFKGLQIRALL
jgi:hypothetical protein